MKNLKWIVCAMLVIAGLLCAFVFKPVSFCGYLMLGCAGLIGLFHLLRERGLLQRILSGLLAVLVLAMVVTGCLIGGCIGGRGEAKSELLIVLGCQVNGTEPSLMLRQRLDAAVDYLNVYPDAQCIVTGGKGDRENISEAQCMYNYLTAAGIDPGRVTMEDASTSTIENLRNTLSVMGETPEHVSILSSEFHLYRAGRMAQDLGIEASLVPAKTEPLPLFLNYFLRDIFALWKYIILGG